MKSYFLAPRETLEKVMAKNNDIGRRMFKIGFLTELEEGVPIEAEKLLVVMEHDDDGPVDHFLTFTGVEHVGDPWHGDKVKPEHHAHLAHFDVKPGDPVVQLTMKAARYWKHYKLRGI